MAGEYYKSDYRKSDEHEVTARKIKLYGDPTPIIDVAAEQNLRCECARVPAWNGFCVVKVFATKADFKRCQYIWLARMIQTKAETEIEL